MQSRKLVVDVLASKEIGTTVEVKGWLRSVRNSKAFAFYVLNDGSCQKSLQIVLDADLPNFAEATKLLIGSAVRVIGKVVESQGKGQDVEMQATLVEIISATPEDYPLQKKATSLEFLRENAHLRMRTNLFGAIFRVRHQLAMATHEFFSSQKFFYLHSPIVTAVDAEGAGEMFSVTALKPHELKAGPDFSKDYFGKQAHLTVSGQLAGECFAHGLGSVYTFGPTFRAENSNTARHLAEFWMIEPEKAFMDLEEDALLASSFVKYLIDSAFKHCPDELEALRAYHEFQAKQDKQPYENHLEMLDKVRNSEFVQVTYTEAMQILTKSGQKFEFPTNWGDEMQTEHERYLSEIHFKQPVIVKDYPKHCKAFYMKQNPDGKTVRAMDVLVPGVGEIIGGSQREDDLDLLITRARELQMNEKSLWWYLDLRRFGGTPHSGFGLGFERAIMYVTGMKNIRDVIAFPRTPNSCEF